MTIGNTNLVASGSEENMFIAKFNNAGALTWVRQAEGGNVDEGGVAVDQAGNVYISGAFESPVNFGGGISLTNLGPLDAFVAKYSSSGAIQWARRAGGTGIGFYSDVALDAQENLYAAGVLASDAGSGGAMVAKYDPAGTLQWTYSGTGAAADPVASLAAKVAVDSAGNCHLAGWYRTATTFGTHILQPRGYLNFFLTRLATGAPTITAQIGGQLTLRWPITAAPYRVESTLSLSSPVTWGNATAIFQTNAGSISAVLPITGAQRFFRLVQP